MLLSNKLPGLLVVLGIALCAWLLVRLVALLPDPLGSLPLSMMLVAILAGLALGIINSIANAYIGTFLSLIILLVAAAVTIVIRPAGLLGVRE